MLFDEAVAIKCNGRRIKRRYDKPFLRGITGEHKIRISMSPDTLKNNASWFYRASKAGHLSICLSIKFHFSIRFFYTHNRISRHLSGDPLINDLDASLVTVSAFLRCSVDFSRTSLPHNTTDFHQIKTYLVQHTLQKFSVHAIWKINISYHWPVPDW